MDQRMEGWWSLHEEGTANAAAAEIGTSQHSRGLAYACRFPLGVDGGVWTHGVHRATDADGFTTRGMPSLTGPIEP